MYVIIKKVGQGRITISIERHLTWGDKYPNPPARCSRHRALRSPWPQPQTSLCSEAWNLPSADSSDHTITTAVLEDSHYHLGVCQNEHIAFSLFQSRKGYIYEDMGRTPTAPSNNTWVHPPLSSPSSPFPFQPLPSLLLFQACSFEQRRQSGGPLARGFLNNTGTKWSTPLPIRPSDQTPNPRNPA